MLELRGELVKKIWAKDSTLWTGLGEENWLGWLNIVSAQCSRIDEFQKIQDTFKKFEQVALLGMGGASLCPEVLAKTFGHMAGFPKLSVLDSTDPDQVLGFESSLNLEKTCFIVSSKSGSTLEPNIFLEYFYSKVKEVMGSSVGQNFVAITDPGSNMEKRAKDLKFGQIFYGSKNIGGRYSALSDFGVIPALAIGLDIQKYLSSALKMVRSCQQSTDNPGLDLGESLGQLALDGFDKMTLVASPELVALPSWIEQLVAESTGKEGKGIIPVIENNLSTLSEFGADRHFIYLKFERSSKNFDKEISQIQETGAPVTVISTADLYDLGQEFFRWEFATAVVGAILKVNPFDQPDVEASKIETRRLTSEIEKTGSLPKEVAKFVDTNFEIFTDSRNWAEIGSPKTLSEVLGNHFKRIKPSDYVGLLSYIDMNEATEQTLLSIKHSLQQVSKAAVCVGFGPRFLHSTGQAYKGGPNTGVFLQIIGQPKHDLNIPNHKFSFGLVQRAQALGDLQVLLDRKRRVLQIQIKGDLEVGLEKLSKVLTVTFFGR
jgi:transaldolase/glucose-6-phosphate isomerase